MSRITHHQSQSNNNNNNGRRRRSVGFAKRTQVFLVLHLADYTDEEISSAWTNDQDIKNNQSDVVNTIKLVRRNANNELRQQLCVRGLEAMTSVERLQERRTNKESVINAVLDEQDRQWDDEGDYPTDWDKISQASREYSSSANDRAQMLGASDAAAARIIQREDKRDCYSIQQEEYFTESAVPVDATVAVKTTASLPEVSRRVSANL